MPKSVITIVCGTYKRLETLKRMVQSVRDTLVDSVPFDFVIADNASQDGTWEWLQAQTDVTPLQMGAPVGAIQAFTHAAKHAQGDYVLLATDDIWFPPNAILKALRWLESTPDCGAVAFAHNKDGFFKVDKQKGLTLDGEKTGMIYPQISLIRRWLGDVCGWWGGDHPHMKNSFTYGGDNFLGMRIAEYGYQTDEVEGCIDYEDTFQDVSRGLSSARHQDDFNNFWALYPDGAVIQPAPIIENPQREHLRVILCLHYDPRFPQHRPNKQGMEQALRNLGHVVVYDYAGAHVRGRDVVHELASLASAWKPHLIWVQAHNEKQGFPPAALVQMRNAAPKAVCVNWNGDYWTENIENPSSQDLYRLFDLILVPTLYLQERLCELGICSAYMPHSFEPAIPDLAAPAYDVVFQGNGYTQFRRDLIQTLYGLPYQVGLYGRSDVVPMSGESNYNFALEQGIYINGKLAVSPMQFDHNTGRGFVSNRMWEIMASGGAMCLQQYVPMLSELTGVQDGVHMIWWHDFEDLKTKIAYYMEHPDEARRIAKAAYDFVHAHHSFDQRIRHVLTEILPELIHPKEAEMMVQ